MDALASDVSRLILRDIEGFTREIAAFADDETLWQTVPGVPNAAGNLAWHVAGNLQAFIGAVLGQSGYVRNRELEFSRRSGTRAETIEELARAATVVERVLAGLTTDVLDAEFPAHLPNGMRPRTRFFLMQLSVHAGFHLGQASYLRRTLSGDATSTGPIPLQS